MKDKLMPIFLGIFLVGIAVFSVSSFAKPKPEPAPTYNLEKIAVYHDQVTVIPATMMWPFGEDRISSPFGDRPQLGYHYGVDFGVDYNTPIPAVAAGTVIFAQWNWGNEVRIQDPSGRYIYIYAHLNRIDVSPGQVVSLGQQIGLVGATGYATGPHLHLEIQDNGVPVDPLPLLREFSVVKYQ